MKESTAMEIQMTHPITINGSPSSSSSSSYSSNPNPNPNPNSMQQWWESISRARSRIQSLISILPPSFSPSLSLLADSDRPARSLLDSPDAFLALSSSLSGAGNDPLCQWLYDTYQSPDVDLRLVALSFLPLISGLYLSRVVSPDVDLCNLAGFEAVLLSLYSSEVKARAGKPLLVSVPDLSLPSLYHSPRPRPPSPSNSVAPHSPPRVGVLSAPLEPHLAVKSTKRACIVAVTLDCYYKHIAHMPPHSKLEFCEFAAAWAGQNCSCPDELYRDCDDGNASTASTNNNNINISFSSEIRDMDSDEDEDGRAGVVEEELGRLSIGRESAEKVNGHCVEIAHELSSLKGSRIPLPWELFQPVLRIVGHCLLAPLNAKEVKDAASMAVRRLYARAMHDLLPQAILATRSLIQLDKRARLAAKVAANSASSANTPTKPKKPEILLASK